MAAETSELSVALGDADDISQSLATDRGVTCTDHAVAVARRLNVEAKALHSRVLKLVGANNLTGRGA